VHGLEHVVLVTVGVDVAPVASLHVRHRPTLGVEEQDRRKVARVWSEASPGRCAGLVCSNHDEVSGHLLRGQHGIERRLVGFGGIQSVAFYEELIIFVLDSTFSYCYNFGCTNNAGP